MSDSPLENTNHDASKHTVNDSKDSTLIVRSALFSGLSGFIPIPFLDDYVAMRIRRYLVANLLLADSKNIDLVAISPIYKDEGGCLSGCFWLLISPLFKIIKKLLKTVFFFLTIRSVALTTGRVWLLGLTLERQLKTSFFRDPKDKQGLKKRAKIFRDTFDQCYKNSDWRFLSSIISQVIESSKPLIKASVAGTRKMFSKGNAQVSGKLTDTEEASVDELSKKLDSELKSKEVLSFLSEFERRFDESLAKRLTESNNGR